MKTFDYEARVKETARIAADIDVRFAAAGRRAPDEALKVRAAGYIAAHGLKDAFWAADYGGEYDVRGIVTAYSVVLAQAEITAQRAVRMAAVQPKAA